MPNNYIFILGFGALKGESKSAFFRSKFMEPSLESIEAVCFTLTISLAFSKHTSTVEYKTILKVHNQQC